MLASMGTKLRLKFGSGMEARTSIYEPAIFTNRKRFLLLCSGFHRPNRMRLKGSNHGGI